MRVKVRLLATLPLTLASTIVYFFVWVFSGTNCTGTGAAYHQCEAFECVYGDDLAGTEILLVTPLLTAAMLLSPNAGRRVWIPIWIVAGGWLLAGRFALFLGLAERIVRHCGGL